MVQVVQARVSDEGPSFGNSEFEFQFLGDITQMADNIRPVRWRSQSALANFSPGFCCFSQRYFNPLP